jgi:hypothetical protein
VQALPSLQELPLAFGGLEQAPVAESHVPASWHWSEAVHTTGLAPTHAPAWQVSVWVQALPSVQEAPLAFAGFEQAPVLGSHAPASWHWSEAVHTTGLAPTHAPAWQLSVCVHALPSVHAVPLAFGGLVQTPVAGLHTPATWHWSEAVHTTGLAPTHAPAWQLSVCVHALPSVQAVPLAFAGFVHTPLAGSQTPGSWH